MGVMANYILCGDGSLPHGIFVILHDHEPCILPSSGFWIDKETVVMTIL